MAHKVPKYSQGKSETGCMPSGCGIKTIMESLEACNTKALAQKVSEQGAGDQNSFCRSQAFQGFGLEEGDFFVLGVGDLPL